MVNEKKPIKHTGNIEFYAEELVYKYLDDLYELLVISDSDCGTNKYKMEIYKIASEKVTKGEATPEQIKFLTDVLSSASLYRLREAAKAAAKAAAPEDDLPF